MTPTEQQNVSSPLPEEIEAVHSDIDQALSDRSEWEAKQLLYYRLRHSRLTRAKKPWPGAADMNWPLADMMIEKIKPYYIQQVFANELLANFFSLTPALQPFNLSAAQWFDHRIRQQSNFETEIISVADYMLSSGKGVFKVRWDTSKKRVVFDSVDPVFILVPAGTTSLEEADWVVQVHQISCAAYGREQNYNQGILDAIKSGNEKAQTAKDSEKASREGVTFSTENSKVVIWEVYHRQGDKIIVFSYSPVLPQEFVETPKELPYEHGEFPFVEFNAEIKDKGYYASRGVPERISALQMSMSKLWNEKLDALTLYNRPVFSSDNPLVNASNIRLVPGSVIPFPVRKVSMDTPPINWDAEINQHRLTAEQMIGVPDAGLSSMLGNSDRRTASEANLIAGIMSQVVDMRSRVFRRALAAAFRQAWALYVQYASAELTYFFRNEMMQLPPAAMTSDYMIEPLASADNLNKQFVFQKKVQRFQLLQGNPFVNQSNLVRDLIAADDPQDVKTLHMDDQTQSADQAEDQAGEIARMLIGFPSQVKPVDDDVVHLMVLKQFVERRLTVGEPISGELATLLMNHANMHFMQLQQKNPPVAEQIGPEMQKLAQFLGTVVAQDQAAAGMGQNGVV